MRKLPSACTRPRFLQVDLDRGGSKWVVRDGQFERLELGHLSRLGPLTNLRCLALSYTGTRRLPPQLSTLHRIEWLDLRYCEAMGQVGRWLLH